MNARYERKFHVEDLSFDEVKNIIELNTKNFRQAYSNRYINNIYFDDFEMNNYKDNIEGNTNRKKVRIRWYGDLKGIIQSPCLEIKIKRGEIGYKDKSDLNNFELIENFLLEYEKIKKNIKKLNKYYIIANLRPTLVNRYQRSYYESYNKEFRLTLDQKLEYYIFFNRRVSFFQNYKQQKSVIVELKYNTQYSYKASEVSNQFPFRLSKSSKYVMGIDKIKPYIF